MRKISTQNPVHIINENGTKISFTHYTELIVFMAKHSYILSNTGTTFVDYYDGYIYHNTFIVRDSFGTIFTKKQLVESIKNVDVKPIHISEEVPYWHKRIPNRYTIRKDPVPLIHRHKKYHYLKHPKTTQERKEWEHSISLIEDTEYKVKLRKKRSPHSLPNLYDDKPRRYYNRTWKEYRKFQYK